MFLDENNHVQWTGVSEYCDLNEMLEWKEKFYVGVPEMAKPLFDKWLDLKLKYNELKAQGKIIQTITTTNSDGTVVVDKQVLKPEIVNFPPEEVKTPA